jgi:putative transposase
MKACGIPPPKRRKHYQKANNGKKPAPANLLNDQALVAAYPNHIWAEDFTYFWFQNRFYYLATVIDLYSRQIVGWALGSRHDTNLITAALMDAVSRHPSPAILHNDRGSEYLSKRYRTICASLEITMSASAPGSPWQNGFQESFYNNFKAELGNLKQLGNEGQLLEAIALQLHYYNTKRIHSSLRTYPAAYAARFEQCEQEKQSLTQQSTTEVRDKVMTISGT